MHRRGFIAAAIAALLAPKAAAAADQRQAAPTPTPSPSPSPSPILLQHSPLAGFQYHRAADLWPRLRPGQALQLTREPAHPHDPRAVRIDWRGHKLGYIPRHDNAALAQLIDRGQPLRARINALREDPNPCRRIEVEIHVLPT